MTSEKIYLYPIWIRIWHWLNASFFLLLVITGLSMQYSSPENMIISFDWAVKLHNISGIAILILNTAFILGNRFTNNGFYYNMTTKKLGTRLSKQARYYLYGRFIGEAQPYPITKERKFNPLQKISYVFVMYFLVPLAVISGIGLFFPEIILENFLHVNGILFTAVAHAAIGFLCSIFLVVHLYLCTMGSKPGSPFKGMFTGYHEH